MFVGPYLVTPPAGTLRRSGAGRRRRPAIACHLTLISMISGMPGTTWQRPRGQYSRADRSPRLREHAGCAPISTPNHEGSAHRGGFGRSNRTGAVLTLGTFRARSLPRQGLAAIRHLTRLDAVERVTRIELAWPAWKESACPPEPLGCARRLDLVAPRGTIIGSGLGLTKGAARLLFDLLPVRPGPEPGRPGGCGLDHRGRRSRRLRSGGRWRMRCRVIVVPSIARRWREVYRSCSQAARIVLGFACLRGSAAVSQRSATGVAAPGHVFSAASYACCPSTIDELTKSSARG